MISKAKAMKKLQLTILALFYICASFQSISSPTETHDSLAELNSAIIPVQKLEDDFYNWHNRHDAVKDHIKAQAVDLVFIGDSITHMFGGSPKASIARANTLWQQSFQPYNALNLGFGWDRTQNVLWRLENGELDGISPKVAVLLIGTNNLVATDNARKNSPTEIVAGIKAICAQLHSNSARTHILLMSLLPRKPMQQFNTDINEINRLLLPLENNAGISFINMHDKFLDEHDQLNEALYHDSVHPNTQGYGIWAQTLTPHLQKWLATKQ